MDNRFLCTCINSNYSFIDISKDNLKGVVKKYMYPEMVKNVVSNRKKHHIKYVYRHVFY